MSDDEQLEILRKGGPRWNVWREEHPKVRPDFKGVDLWGVDLWSADLRGADLRGADIREADLRRADLSRTRIEYANLTSADLRGANLWGATLGATQLGDLDLSQTEGLEGIKHISRSSLGVDTLYNSRGKIPEVFLRGCGIPENLLTYLPSLVSSSAFEFYSCFISYSHPDKSFARRLHDQLQGRGIRCWLDEHQMRPGDDIYEMVDRGIRLWDKVLLCCSEASLTSWWVDKEINAAFRKEQRLTRERARELQGRKVLCLVPLNLDGYLLSGRWQSGKAADVLSRLAADFTGWEHDNAKFEGQFERVMLSLLTDEYIREIAPGSKL
ncbi:MAG: toll/interleukin-1 receptor domain-containing protein [bacterium]|nr:toll/interleukin-1 receptor domain-containing protein [bacterium]